MTFAAFTSAMVVRQASLDWRHFTLPSMLYLNTAILLMSSVTIEIARKRVTSFARTLKLVDRLPCCGWLSPWARTLFDSRAICGVAAAEIRMKLYRSCNLAVLSTSLPRLTPFIFSAVLAGLLLVIWRFSRPVSTLHVSTLSTVSYYWHFMDVLWIYLLLLLWTRI